MAVGKKISDYTPITGDIVYDDDLMDVSQHLGFSVYQTRSLTIAGLKKSMPPIYTIDLMDALDVTFYCPIDNISIDSVSDFVNSPTTTILVAGGAYSFGTDISIGDTIKVSVTVNAVVQLITSL